MNYIFAFLIGYALGCINPAYICGRLKGLDIRQYGSHNAGASNAKVVLGWPYFFLVLAYDTTKTIIAFLLTKYLFNNDMTLAVLAGCATVIGHNFPFYLQFKGGKGLACYIGLCFILNWKVCLVIAVVGLIFSYISNWIIVLTMSFIIVTPISQLFLSDCSRTGIICLTITSIIIFCKHIINFKKLVQKKEIGINGCYVGTKIKADITQ